MAKTLISICTSRERQWRWCESCLVMWTAVIWIEKKKGTKPCKSCAKLPLTIYSLVKARYIEKRVLGQYEFSRVYRLVDCVVAMIAMEATPSHFHCQPSVFFGLTFLIQKLVSRFFFRGDLLWLWESGGDILECREGGRGLPAFEEQYIWRSSYSCDDLAQNKTRTHPRWHATATGLRERQVWWMSGSRAHHILPKTAQSSSGVFHRLLHECLLFFFPELTNPLVDWLLFLTSL